MAQVSARAGIHRGNKLELRGKFRLPGGTRHADLPRLERFAQHFEHVPVEFGKLVEEEHAMHGHRNLARTRIATSADECHG